MRKILKWMVALPLVGVATLWLLVLANWVVDPRVQEERTLMAEIRSGRPIGAVRRDPLDHRRPAQPSPFVERLGDYALIALAAVFLTVARAIEVFRPRRRKAA